MQRHQLTEEEKIRAIRLYDKYGKKWTVIARMIGCPESTIRSFINRYLEKPQLFLQRGAPKKVTDDVKDGIIGAFEEYPELDLTYAAGLFDLGTTTIRTVLHEDGISYMQKICTPPLSDAHKTARVNFCRIFNNIPYHLMPNLIITDESTVEVCLNNRGIWRRKGIYPPEAFYQKVSHPISVMIWGGIGPRGYRTQLLRVKGNMKSEDYCNMLINNNIIANLHHNFGNNFVFQQDNAPPHSSHFTKVHLLNHLPSVLEWPARSPDLSPIEQLWDYIKGKIAGEKFVNADQLFNRLAAEWASIPNEMIHNFYSSFKARCKVCEDLRGENLNGHWKEVHKEHDKYRTRIIYLTDANGNVFISEQ